MIVDVQEDGIVSTSAYSRVIYSNLTPRAPHGHGQQSRRAAREHPNGALGAQQIAEFPGRQQRRQALPQQPHVEVQLVQRRPGHQTRQRRRTTTGVQTAIGAMRCVGFELVQLRLQVVLQCVQLLEHRFDGQHGGSARNVANVLFK